MEFEALIDILKNECGIENDTISPDDRLTEDLCMNSLSYMLLISTVERKLNIDISISDIKNIKTVEEFYMFINKIVRG